MSHATISGFLRRRGLSIAAAALAAAGCSHGGTGAVKAPSRALAQTGDAWASGTWTPLVTLKDVTETFAGDHESPRPEDGWWVTPIHANLLADGKVLITGWSRSKESYCLDHQGRRNGTTFVLDPKDLDAAEAKTLPIVPLDEQPEEPGQVLYCAGHAPLRDGRILFTGGATYKNLDVAATQDEFGLNYARIFDPRTRAIHRLELTNPGGPHPTAAQRMNGWEWYKQGSMWYPTNTRLPGGRILVAGGWAKWADVLRPDKFDFLNKSLTLFDPGIMDRGGNPWRVLVNHETSGDELAIDTFDYVHAMLLPRPVLIQGRPRQVALFGGGKIARFAFLSIDPDTPESERLVTQPHAQRPDVTISNDSSAALLGTGEILIAGGGLNGKKESQRLDVYDPYADAWRTIDTHITRRRPSSVLLPDGTVLVLSGENKDWDPPDNEGDRRQPMLYDPETRGMKVLDPWPDDERDRGYHNVALLLSDGRVLVGGGRTRVVTHQVEEYRIGCERPDIRIFSPPYLDPGRGPRPEILGSSAPLRLTVGGSAIRVVTSGARLKRSGGVALMALGAQTHAFDQNQRYVRLRFSQDPNGVLTIRPPETALQAPAGLYNLFLVSETGKPSRGKPVVLEE